MSATFPSSSLRLSLGPAEWEACLDTWLTLVETTLHLQASSFATICRDADVFPNSLASFYEAIAWPESHDSTIHTEKALVLRKLCFRAIKRVVTEVDQIPQSLWNLEFLAAFCHVHMKSAALPALVDKLWSKRAPELTLLVQKRRTVLTTALESQDGTLASTSLLHLAPIVHSLPIIGSLMMTGSDFLDALANAFVRQNSDAERRIVSNFLFLSLMSLTRTKPPSITVLTDHLYTLKTQADQVGPRKSILAAIVTNTPILLTLRRDVALHAPERFSKLLESLATYQTPSIAWTNPRSRPKKKIMQKGKGKALDSGLPHVHKMSLVTQIQDLFPDLGSGFVLKLLDEYNDDVEQATAHLLEDSLPPHLASLDRSEQLPILDSRPQTQIDHLAPRSTPPLPSTSYVPERRNVFDDDDLDRLTHDTSRLHTGKANKHHLSPTVTENATHKAAILSALATFDSDDDERDDTYDTADVGGAMDAAHPDGETTDRTTSQALTSSSFSASVAEHDVALYKVFQSSPQLFARSADIRRSQARAALRVEVGMTDEALEGWAVMLQRDPKRLRRLELAASGAGATFDGRQAALVSSAYRDGDEVTTETEEDSDAVGGVAVRGGGSGVHRGRGRGRGGRGRGNVSGPSNDPNTAHAQRRKEASKGSRANHNRRDQRARKMARGGFPG